MKIMAYDQISHSDTFTTPKAMADIAQLVIAYEFDSPE